jgi:Transposase DDE domain
VAADRVISVVDPDARHLHKRRSSYRDGDKAHLAAEPETGLICGAALTPATTADGPSGWGCWPPRRQGSRSLGDAAYGSGETRAALRAAGHVQLIKPIPLSAAVPGGFTKDDFAIDLHAGTVTCPAGQTVAITPGGRAVFDWRGGRCSLRERCTRAKDGKTVNLHPHQAELAAARRQATDPAFQASYRRWRPMVERSIAWLVAKGHRRVRYRGLARNQLGLSLRVAAINLRRLVTMGLDHGAAGWMLA